MANDNRIAHVKSCLVGLSPSRTHGMAARANISIQRVPCDQRRVARLDRTQDWNFSLHWVAADPVSRLALVAPLSSLGVAMV